MKKFLWAAALAAFFLPAMGLTQVVQHTIPTLDRDNTWTGVNTYTQSPQVPEPTADKDAVPKDYVDAHSGANLPHDLNGIAGDGAGGALWMPEKGVNKAADQAFIAWDEDAGLGRMDCRNAKYGPGGCLGANAAQAMQDLSDDMTCWQVANPGKHASTLLPAGTISVGTPTHPTLTFPDGVFIRGTGGEGGAANLTGSVLQGHYNNQTVFKVEGSHVATSAVGNCHGTPVTNTTSGGSYERFSVTGCAVGGCTNVPGDSGNYPQGGPLNIGINIYDAAYWADQLVGMYTAADGVIFDGIDARIGQAFAYSHDSYFYFGLDRPGQNYQFSGPGEFHGGVVLKAADSTFYGPYETYGTFMDLGWEYGHIAGVVWSGDLSALGPVFSQIEEIDEIRTGTGPSTQWGGRFDAARGVSLWANGGGDTYLNPRAISPCIYDGANKYVIATVTTATPGSGQTPGTYLLTASTGQAQISVMVGGGGTVTTDPTVTIHGRNYTSTPPTFTLAAGGTPATFTVTMETVWQIPSFNANGGQHRQENFCDPFVHVTTNFGVDTFVAPIVQNFDGIFGPSHATGDIYSPSGGGPANWVLPSGTATLSSGSGGLSVRWDVALGDSPGENQRISLPDVSLAYNFNFVSGTTLDLNVTGGTFTMGNSSPTTISSITNGWLQEDVYILGDGFTTIPAVHDFNTGLGTGGVVGCSPDKDLLLAKNRLYHFKLENVQSAFLIPVILAEVGCDYNQNYQHIGFNAFSSSPPLNSLATVHVAGTIAVSAYPALPQGTLTQAGGVTSFNYCFIREVRVAGGVQTDTPVCSTKPPVVAGPFNNLFYHGSIPLNWTEYKIVFQSTTDASFTSLLGTVVDVTSPDGTPQLPVADVNYPIQPSSLSSDGYNIPTASQGLNITGTYTYDLTLTPPSVTTTFCNKGQFIPNVGSGFDYMCDVTNHWVRRAANAWSAFP